MINPYSRIPTKLVRFGNHSIKWMGSLSGRPIRRIAFNQHLLTKSWGGGNQFLSQLAIFLAGKGFEITYELDPLVTHVFIIDVRPIVTCTFTIEDAKKFKKKFPHVKIIHRINNCDQKYTDEELTRPEVGVDQRVKWLSDIVDRHVFISEWLQQYHHHHGFKTNLEQCVITNAADDYVFYPDTPMKNQSGPIRLITHHWSDNWLKGYKVYQQIDELIASGELQGFELTVIGRWPKEIQWKSAKTYGPMQGMELANKLREHDLYVTASQWEPGGMHFIEGMQCGLPVVYHKDGGGICEVAQRAGIMFDTDVKSALLEAKTRYAELKEKVLTNAPSSKIMCEEFYRIIAE